MPGKKPDIVKLYRIAHIANIEYLLTHGMFTRHHEMADKDYINIGDTDLILKRNVYPVKVNPPNGVLGDYVPFYFGPLSPMLLKIKSGNGGVTRRPQQDIVYIVCELTNILNHCENWCFTDGHAKTAITGFYNDIAHLTEVDWNLVRERYWNNTEEDIDRVRRKQAEFLVHNHVPAECISAVVTFDEASKSLIENILKNLALKIPVGVNPNNKFYY